MERKRIICRIFVLTLLAVAALSLCAFADADPPYYFDYKTIFYKGIMPSEKVLDFPVDCNTLTGSVNL